MPHRRLFALVLSSLLALNGASAGAQDASTPATAPKAGGNWQRVEALPARTHVHISTDHGGTTCRLYAVSDDTLTCEAGSGKAGKVIQRPEIRHIKLTHYGRSTLVGAGVGGGIGALSGAIAGRNQPCNTGFCFNILGPGAVAAVVGVGGAAIGSIVGGTSDMARGSAIYVRP